MIKEFIFKFFVLAMPSAWTILSSDTFFHGSCSELILILVQMPFCHILYRMCLFKIAPPSLIQGRDHMDPHMTLPASLPFLAALQGMETRSKPLIPSLEQKEEEVQVGLCSPCHSLMWLCAIIVHVPWMPRAADFYYGSFLIWEHTEHVWTQ